jgi:pimeloyl-ACP methyl ester carboxylesterase
MASTMVAVDGGDVWADDSGGDGPPLVMLHPGVGDSRIWEPVLAPLVARYRVIRYDARGFGESPAPVVKFSLLRDLIAVLDHFGVGRTALVGCSQGGASSLELALAQPERVSALVLLCPGIPGFPMTDEDEAAMIGADKAAEIEADYTRAQAAGDVDALAAVVRRIWGAGGDTPVVIEQARSAARASIVSDGLELEDPPLFDRLGEIAVPAALMVGDADYPPLVEANRQAAPRIPGCEFVLVPGMDHFPPLREPGLVLDLITRTLARASW